MSRAGYSDDIDNWQFIKWRGQVASATRGKRGQDFFRALIEALDALPEKRLISADLRDDNGCVCALGALAVKRGVDLDSVDTYDYGGLGNIFNIAHQLAQEVMYENDEGGIGKVVDNKWRPETPEERWTRMRAWAVSQLKAPL